MKKLLRDFKNPNFSRVGEIAKRVKATVEEARGSGFKKKDIAKKALGVSSSQLTNLLKGSSQLSAVQIESIADYLGISVQKLLRFQGHEGNDGLHQMLEYVMRHGDRVQRGLVVGLIKKFFEEIRSDPRGLHFDD